MNNCWHVWKQGSRPHHRDPFISIYTLPTRIFLLWLSVELVSTIYQFRCSASQPSIKKAVLYFPTLFGHLPALYFVSAHLLSRQLGTHMGWTATGVISCRWRVLGWRGNRLLLFRGGRQGTFLLGPNWPSTPDIVRESTTRMPHNRHPVNHCLWYYLMRLVCPLSFVAYNKYIYLYPCLFHTVHLDHFTKSSLDPHQALTLFIILPLFGSWA